MEKKKQAVENWIAAKTKKNPVEIYLERPKRPVFKVSVEGAPFVGGENAKVVVAEFSDFQCPYCAKGAEVMKELKKKYGSKIKIAFKNYPLPFHKDAKVAAQAALCAKEQGGDSKFWAMHDKMFANQAKLSKDGLKELAGQSGLDANKISECIDSGKYLAAINKDIEEGKNIGVKSTPTFFVNGQLINGAQDVSVFSEIIDQELKK